MISKSFCGSLPYSQVLEQYIKDMSIQNMQRMQSSNGSEKWEKEVEKKDEEIVAFFSFSIFFQVFVRAAVIAVASYRSSGVGRPWCVFRLAVFFAIGVFSSFFRV